MKTKANTKAQESTLARLERRGYDYSHTNSGGLPVVVNRERNIWVEILRNGAYRPASK
jgi:hypothetical protein